MDCGTTVLNLLLLLSVRTLTANQSSLLSKYFYEMQNDLCLANKRMLQTDVGNFHDQQMDSMHLKALSWI